VVEGKEYVPQRGEVVWVSLNPQVRHEQVGRRPAVVVSPGSYNSKAGLALLCPITSRIKGYPFEVNLPEGLPTSGAVLSDQVKCLDWRARHAELLCALPQETISEILQKLATLVTQ
jgi:mRNA interferase MazF